MNVSTPVVIAMPPAASPPVGELLAELTAGLAAGDDLEALLQRFLEPLLRLSGAKAGAVRTLSDDGTHMRLLGSVGLDQDLLAGEREVERDCGVCGQALAGAPAVWTDDLRLCVKHNAGEFIGHGFDSVTAVPLRYRDQVLGVVNLFYARGTPPRTEVAALLRPVGELLGLALHHARLEREQLRAAVLHERQMLAGEVHDAVAQTLVYMKMRLPLLHDALIAHDDARALKYQDDLRQAVSDAHASLRQILTHFRTRMDPKGLLHALRGLQAGYLDRHGIRLVVDSRAAALHLSVEQELQVFHIVQEALANVARHSRARQAHVAVHRVGGDLHVVVEDDGAGISAAGLHGAEPAEDGAHFGLDIMRERAQRLGGTLAVQARDGGGTCVRLSIPIGEGGRSVTP